MRVGRPVRESNLEGMMEESGRVMRVRMVGVLVSVGVSAMFLSESWLMFCGIECLGVMGAAVSSGVGPVLMVCALVGGGRSRRSWVGGSLICCCKTPGLSGGP